MTPVCDRYSDNNAGGSTVKPNGVIPLGNETSRKNRLDDFAGQVGDVHHADDITVIPLDDL